MTARKRRGTRGDVTRTRILDTAERLFAAEGYAAVSLRQITGAASVNVAAINYYFKSKDALLEAIFVRRIVPINEARMAMLEACLASNATGLARLEGVIRAFVEPHLRLTREFGPGGTVVMQLLGRLSTDPERRIEKVLLKQYDPIWWRFAKEFGVLLPHLDKATIYWRFYYLLGALYYLTSARQWLPRRSEKLCNPDNLDDTIDSLVPFLVGALSAPA
ncbi:MAG: TetR family transcriptional regulator [Rhodospirillaceae bacterium]|nr:TetR family transcriptional regulator [Rhodospirillaceae bacterium]